MQSTRVIFSGTSLGVGALLLVEEVEVIVGKKLLLSRKTVIEREHSKVVKALGAERIYVPLPVAYT